MPIYEYQCDDCGATVEAFQKMSDDPLTVCEECGGPLHKVLHPVAIHFKGSGFYTTDYGKGSGRRAGGKDGGQGDGASADAGGSTGAGADAGPAAGKKPSSGESKSKEKQKSK